MELAMDSRREIVLERKVFNNILVATDFSECSERAHSYAVGLARLYGAKLIFVHVRTDHAAAPELALYAFDLVTSAIEQNVTSLEKWLRKHAVKYEVLVAGGTIQDVIGNLAEKVHVDLIVLGTHGRQGLGRFILGSVAEMIFRSTNCPALTVGPHVPAAGDRLAFPEILLAAEDTPESIRAASYAISIAEEFQSNLSLLHVAPTAARFGPDSRRVARAMQGKLNKLAPQDAFIWSEVNYCLEYGEPVEEILAKAERINAQLIVLGVREAVSFTSHLPGRTAYQIITRAHCPVLTIRGGGRGSLQENSL